MERRKPGRTAVAISWPKSEKKLASDRPATVGFLTTEESMPARRMVASVPRCRKRARCMVDALPQDVDRGELQRLVAQGAQLVEVLPLEEYEDEHLPGAIHLPLRKIETDADAILDRKRPIVVYCWDTA
jgi:hypothetical protein